MGCEKMKKEGEKCLKGYEKAKEKIEKVFKSNNSIIIEFQI